MNKKEISAAVENVSSAIEKKAFKAIYTSVIAKQLESILTVPPSTNETKLVKAMANNVKKFLEAKKLKVVQFEVKATHTVIENEGTDKESKVETEFTWPILVCKVKNERKEFAFIIHRGTDAGDSRPIRSLIFQNDRNEIGIEINVRTNGFLTGLIEGYSVPDLVTPAKAKKETVAKPAEPKKEVPAEDVKK